MVSSTEELILEVKRRRQSITMTSDRVIHRQDGPPAPHITDWAATVNRSENLWQEDVNADNFDARSKGSKSMAETFTVCSVGFEIPSCTDKIPWGNIPRWVASRVSSALQDERKKYSNDQFWFQHTSIQTETIASGKKKKDPRKLSC